MLERQYYTISFHLGKLYVSNMERNKKKAVKESSDTHISLVGFGKAGYALNYENGFYLPYLQCLTSGSKAGGYSSMEMRVLYGVRDFFTHRS